VTATLRTVTLGCKVNQYETQWVREGLLRAGYVDASGGEPADLCLVNTCTVTAEGDAKSRQIIRRLHRQNPGSKIVVMGCYATRAPAEVRSLPGVDEVLLDKREIPDWLQRHGVADVPRGVSRLDGRSRAYVKVQDGCLLRCSYCIIPAVRPRMASRPLQEIVDEVRSIVDGGVREIVLTGIHLGHYGVDFNAGKPKSQWIRLANLVEWLCRIPGQFRLRLSSIEATEVSRELVAVMSQHGDKVCPHLHVCLQSGSDSVLRRMRRRWGAKRFIDRCRLVQQQLDQPALTTDVIVGFPGESESDFQQTLAVCRDAGFSKIHSFPFSPRRGTPAAEMPDQVAPEVKAERLERLAQCERELRRTYFDSLVGRSVRVLIESRGAATARGTACRYAPTEIESCLAPAGSLVTAEVVAADTDRLLARTRG
jgi:threonylcarbamoyladenosine tRNA methylthiotransferase MtaB